MFGKQGFFFFSIPSALYFVLQLLSLFNHYYLLKSLFIVWLVVLTIRSTEWLENPCTRSAGEVDFKSQNMLDSVYLFQVA